MRWARGSARAWSWEWRWCLAWRGKLGIRGGGERNLNIQTLLTARRADTTVEEDNGHLSLSTDPRAWLR